MQTVFYVDTINFNGASLEMHSTLLWRYCVVKLGTIEIKKQKTKKDAKTNRNTRLIFGVFFAAFIASIVRSAPFK